MKPILILIFILSFNLSFSQQVTKYDLKNLIKQSRKEESKSGLSYYSKLISNNEDSTFFKSNKVILYSTKAATAEKGYCRTVELNFMNRKRVNFIDCQTCSEPSFCYVTTDKNIYSYKIKEKDNQLYIVFTNSYNQMNFEIVSSSEKNLNGRKYLEIGLRRK